MKKSIKVDIYMSFVRLKYKPRKTYSYHIFYSYRMERAMMIDILKNSMENEIMIYKAIIHAVDIHRKAMKYLYQNIYQQHY